MPVPPPHKFLEVIPSATASACDRLVKVLRTLPELIYQWISSEYKSPTEFTDSYAAMLRSVVCQDGRGMVWTCSATDGAHPDKVLVVWPVYPPNAAAFDVYRRELPYGLAVRAGTVSVWSGDTVLFEDVVSETNRLEPGKTYLYYIVAKDAAGIGLAVSGGDEGSIAPWAARPSNVSATFGTMSNAIKVTWTGVVGAVKYRVLRAIGATAPESEAETVTDDCVATEYTDSQAALNTDYSYWVSAYVGGKWSENSDRAVGRRGTVTVVEFSAAGTQQEWIVPAGVSDLTVHAWGAGGGGGTASTRPGYPGSGCPPGWWFCAGAGGGGGSGAFAAFQMSVSGGQKIIIQVGKGGRGAPAGTGSETPGSPGGATQVMRAGSTVGADVPGGSGGASRMTWCIGQEGGCTGQQVGGGAGGGTPNLIGVHPMITFTGNHGAIATTASQPNQPSQPAAGGTSIGFQGRTAGAGGQGRGVPGAPGGDGQDGKVVIFY